MCLFVVAIMLGFWSAQCSFHLFSPSSLFCRLSWLVCWSGRSCNKSLRIDDDAWKSLFPRWSAPLMMYKVFFIAELVHVDCSMQSAKHKYLRWTIWNNRITCVWDYFSRREKGIGLAVVGRVRWWWCPLVRGRVCRGSHHYLFLMFWRILVSWSRRHQC